MTVKSFDISSKLFDGIKIGRVVLPVVVTVGTVDPGTGVGRPDVSI
jgi:hypothetical protein